jgi:hydrogenase-1 operon protein HyaF
MANVISPIFGPGSQPGDEDGGALTYMKMPAGMSTYAHPHLPEAEEAMGCKAAIAALERVLLLLKADDGRSPLPAVDLAGLSPADLDLVNQVLGEGEVAAIAGTRVQAQESVLAGVWRVRLTDDEGRIERDLIEVAAFPTAVLACAFDSARPAVAAPTERAAGIANAPALLAEIDEHAAKVGPGRPPHVINLSLLPHTEEDLRFLDAALGRGAVTVLSRGYGNCRITATATRHVWWVRFYNSQDTLILDTIEIITVPAVACAAPEDLADSAARLDEILELYR